MFVAAFPTGLSVCWGGGGGGGGGGQQASSLSSKHKLWNFHRYLLVVYEDFQNYGMYSGLQVCI